MTSKRWLIILMKLCFGVYFVLTSIYCLLAFIPYTYSFLIKESPSDLLTAFAQYHSLLYWLAFGAGLLAYWEQRKRAITLGAWALLALIGVMFTAQNFVPHIQNNWNAYWCGILVLIPVLFLSGLDFLSDMPAETESRNASLLCYSNALIVTAILAVISAGAVSIRNYVQATASGLWPALLHVRIGTDLRTLELASLVLASYLWLSLLIVSVINLLLIGVTRATRRPLLTRMLSLLALVFGILVVSASRFLQSALSLQPWPARVYAVTLAATLSLWGFALMRPLFDRDHGTVLKQLAPWLMGLSTAFIALVLPATIGDRDWNGIAQNAFVLLFWVIASIFIYLVRGRTVSYSVPALLAVLLLAGTSYWGMTASAFLWAGQLGKNDGEIQRAIEQYAAQDASFNLVYHWRDGGNVETCDNLCLTLRQYTNIRDAEITREVNLVEALAPTKGMRPNILVIVIDSMRQDYLGVYNPRIDFTPNLDNFARDCAVMRNAFTPYAGTTLAEPSIWTGTLLLHAHYVHPFANVNTLERLLRVDGYQMILSFDSVLRRILTKTDDAIKLDTDIPWNRFEASATFRQLESVLDKRRPNDRPFFFYAQPMNVHQFGVNDRPRLSASNWVMRPGLNNRSAYEAHQVDESLGDLFNYLRSRDLYDNSIIIVTADHGEGSSELGHFTHGTVIYPEIMRVPLLIHLPKTMRARMLYDESALASLTDIAPTLYALLGHVPITKGPLFGRPLFAETKKELQNYPRRDLLLASDVRAAYGLLSGDSRFMYVTYDSPSKSYLYDLANDPDGAHSVLQDSERQIYEQRLIEYLQTIAEFYGYKPNGNAPLVAVR